MLEMEETCMEHLFSPVVMLVAQLVMKAIQETTIIVGITIAITYLINSFILRIVLF
jgi:hypothetical protein